MKRNFTIILFMAALFSSVEGQSPGLINWEKEKNNISYSDPGNLKPPSSGAPGYPVKITAAELLDGFTNPPPGYGEVPFWWWSGDKLDKERILWQIEELHRKGITGMQVNYIHKDSPGWPTWPPDPEIFSDEWWSIWKFAAEEAGKRSMGIGLSGYTIDWPRSRNLYNRTIYLIREIQGREIEPDTIVSLGTGESLSVKVPEGLIYAGAYEKSNGKLTPGGKDLKSFINDGLLDWKNDGPGCEVWLFTARRKPGTLNPAHPLSGKTVIEKFFQPFEEKSGENGPAGLNYFFQDELQFGVGNFIWCDDFAEQFSAAKGYDIFGVLPALFTDMGPVTTKAKLDYMDVKVRLTEERYFIPIFNWHQSRGKIYGCDPEGRGKSPGEYGDNFRAIRWYTAPGHDTPSGKADLIKGKVSSSIAALYRRPRVWLEGYHSLGWGATPGQIMYATIENYIYGCNLLNLHGLYYTTHGSFWEWAPPCYHFRMPYWDHMTVFLKYFERLSWLMSNSVLKADIAICYPVSPVQAGMSGEKATNQAFETGADLFNRGYDFMFIDDQSLVRAVSSEGKLKVTDQEFRILVLPSLKAIRWTTLMRALDFYRNGGIVIATGELPSASDHAGSGDPELDKVVKELFGVTAAELKAGTIPVKMESASGGKGIYIAEPSGVEAVVRDHLLKDLRSDEKVKYSHRTSATTDIYLVLGASKGSWCTFRAEGVPERLDPWTGKRFPVRSYSEGIGLTKVQMPLTAEEAQVIIFTPGTRPGTTSPDSDSGKKTAPVSRLIDGDWEFELKPTMDNQWGDFRLPVTEKMIGPEARIFRYSRETGNSEGWEKPGFDDSSWEIKTYGYGQNFWKLGPLPGNQVLAELEKEFTGMTRVNPEIPVKIGGKEYFWKPYSYSWRSGFEGDPGHQGFHGLKEQVTDEFICLGKPVSGLNETLYKEENEGSVYFLWTTAGAKIVTNVTIDTGGLVPSKVFLNGKQVNYEAKNLKLKKGYNPLLLRYDSPGRGHFVLLAEGAAINAERTPLSMRWYDYSGLIKFDPFPGSEKRVGWYRFTAPPGLESMIIPVSSGVTVWTDGKMVEPHNIAGEGTGKLVQLKTKNERETVVAIRAELPDGVSDGALFGEPVLLSCGTGLFMTGDWSMGSVLVNYSGSAYYRKKITLSASEAGSEIILDLGEVIATAGIKVNGRDVATLVAAPWRTDISEFVREGVNEIEILVCNTLANHYLTVPTKYRGTTLKSGLIGPVKLEISTREK